MEYLAEGVIPFLHIFYKSFFDPDNLSKDAEREKEFEISSNIARSLMVHTQFIAIFFTSNSTLAPSWPKFSQVTSTFKCIKRH